MKLVASKESYSIIELDKEAIKAIRFCCGYTTDLRKQIGVCGAEYSKIYDFVWINKEILGDRHFPDPIQQYKEYLNREHLVTEIAHCVCYGKPVKGGIRK